jgi:hypothetical protein
VKAKSVKNLKTVLAEGRRGIKDKRRAAYYDAFFADPESVENDYHRLKGSQG